MSDDAPLFAAQKAPPADPRCPKCGLPEEKNHEPAKCREWSEWRRAQRFRTASALSAWKREQESDDRSVERAAPLK